MQMLAATQLDDQTADDAAALFKLLGDPTRMRILYELSDTEELCVHEIASAIDASETKVSQALRLLRTAGVVRNRRAGRHIHYRLDDEHVRTLLTVTQQHISHVGELLMGHGRTEHDHQHGPSLARAGERHRTPLLISFVLIAGFFVVEAVAGFLTGSLALLSDAGHMMTDVIGLGMALAAIEVASRFSSGKRSFDPHTFGVYRLEILASFVNALLLFGVAIWVLTEAVRRLFDEPEVLGVPMLIVATIGLVVNLIAFMLLREGSKESLNVEGAYLEVLADTVGSVGVIIAAVLLEAFGWWWADPIVAAAIGLWILPRTWRLGRRAVRILLQAAPTRIDLKQLTSDLGSIDTVVDVHDLHVWTLTSEMDAASAHLMTVDGADSHAVLDEARSVLTKSYGISHGTFQVEPEAHTGCHDITW